MVHCGYYSFSRGNRFYFIRKGVFIVKSGLSTFNPIGNLIHTQRKNAHLNLSQLEELSGVAIPVIAKLENGEIKRPCFDTVHALCTALHVPYSDIVKLFLSVETRAEFLLSLFKHSATEEPSLCSLIAQSFLRDDQKDSYDLVDELFSLVPSIQDRSVQLSLFKLISNHSRLHGIQTYLAKALLQQYLIERDDFHRLSTTYDVGMSILDYVHFLTQEEKVTFYYKLGVHAYHLSKYKEAIQIFENIDALNIEDAEIRAWIFIVFCSSYIHLGELDIATSYLKLAETYEIPLIKENIQFFTGQLNAKKGNIDTAIRQLQQCIKHASYKINAVNILFNLYLEREEWSNIEKLIAEEHHFLNLQIKHPDKMEENAYYYENKSKYYNLQHSFNNQLECLFKSANIYAKIDQHQKAYNCFELICKSISNKTNISELPEKIKTLFAEFKVYSKQRGLK